jgi:hypothetical protein
LLLICAGRDGSKRRGIAGYLWFLVFLASRGGGWLIAFVFAFVFAFP